MADGDNQQALITEDCMGLEDGWEEALYTWSYERASGGLDHSGEVTETDSTCQSVMPVGPRTRISTSRSCTRCWRVSMWDGYT